MLDILFFPEMLIVQIDRFFKFVAKCVKTFFSLLKMLIVQIYRVFYFYFLFYFICRLCVIDILFVVENVDSAD